MRSAPRADISGPALRRLREDIHATLDGDATGGSGAVVGVAARAMLTTKLQSLILFRIAQALSGAVSPLSAVLKYLNAVVTGADIATQASIGGGLRLFHPNGVVIGPECRLGAGCTVMQGATLGAGVGGSPVLGQRVFVGAGAKVFGAITIGDGCVIGANAVVMSSAPDRVFIAGVPAKIIGPIRDDSAPGSGADGQPDIRP